ncbi:type VI immunity family protein [Ahrensia kielensis]|uniref:Type VI immunity family protein n=1 Tax=Ahrensia kielensis TaxID=76980 RepID=A0ABU9T675_9HYPH
MPNPLLYDDEIAALPAFRTLAYLDGAPDDPRIALSVGAMFDAFVARFGGDLGLLSMRLVGHSGKPSKVTPRALKNLRSWISAPDRLASGAGVRLGAINTDELPPAMPWFRLEQRYDDQTMVEISVSPDAPDLLSFADEIASALATAPMICAAQGFGFFLPTAYDSLNWLLPRIAGRYKAALMHTLDMPSCGLRRAHSAMPYVGDMQPGIADIGWRTFIGPEYLDRLPKAFDLPSDVSVEACNKMLILTAGKAPIWGDSQQAENIENYRAVAAALAPVRYPYAIALNQNFGGDTAAVDQAELIEAHYHRLD